MNKRGGERACGAPDTERIFVYSAPDMSPKEESHAGRGFGAGFGGGAERFGKLVRNESETPLLICGAVLHFLNSDPAVLSGFLNQHGDIGGGVERVAAATTFAGILPDVVDDNDDAAVASLKLAASIYERPMSRAELSSVCPMQRANVSRTMGFFATVASHRHCPAGRRFFQSATRDFRCWQSKSRKSSDQENLAKVDLWTSPPLCRSSTPPRKSPVDLDAAACCRKRKPRCAIT
jgi:hypothetical protein